MDIDAPRQAVRQKSYTQNVRLSVRVKDIASENDRARVFVTTIDISPLGPSVPRVMHDRMSDIIFHHNYLHIRFHTGLESPTILWAWSAP
eukprot:7273491-Pyramimonas_sp.AAC.1